MESKNNRIPRGPVDIRSIRLPVIHVLLYLVASIAFTTTADARIKRSQWAKIEFKYQHPCPATGARKGPCKGYVIDHRIALACGGPDRSENMQWQTVADAKAKDKWERKGCGK